MSAPLAFLRRVSSGWLIVPPGGGEPIPARSKRAALEVVRLRGWIVARAAYGLIGGVQ